jgi:hypothetical protein
LIAVSRYAASMAGCSKRKMENDLSLSMRMGCDASRVKCRGELPVKTRRVVSLELLP